MESKLYRQQNAMISLSKPKYKTALPEKKNTWSNVLTKKSTSTNTAIAFNKNSKKDALISQNYPKSMNFNCFLKIFLHKFLF